MTIRFRSIDLWFVLFSLLFTPMTQSQDGNPVQSDPPDTRTGRMEWPEQEFIQKRELDPDFIEEFAGRRKAHAAMQAHFARNPQALDELRRQGEDISELTEPVPDLPPLEGPHDFGFAVVDAATDDPIPEFVVHAFFYVPNQFGANEDGRNPFASLPELAGRIESQNIQSTDGVCLYHKLPEGEFQLKVLAQGYIPGSIKVQIPNAGEIGRIELMRGRSIRGKLIRDDTGAPMPGLNLELTYEAKKDDQEMGSLGGGHYAHSYECTSGADGAFKFELLPPDTYFLRIADFPHTVAQARSKLGGAGNPFTAPPTQLDPSDAANRLKAELEKEYFMQPEIEPVDLGETEEADLGEIRIQRTPVLDLEVVDEKERVLANYPFDLMGASSQSITPSRRGESNLGSFRTDGQGKAKLPLIGIKAKEQLLVCIPSVMDEVYQFRFPGEKPKDILEGFNEKKELDKLIHEYEEIQRLRSDEANDSDGVSEAILSDPPSETALKDEVEQRKKSLIARSKRPLHPNVTIVNPRPGETIKVRAVYHPTENEVNLTMMFRNKATRAPVEKLSGAISGERSTIEYVLWPTNTNREMQGQSDISRIKFEAAEDASGRVEIAHLPIPDDMLRNERQLSELLAANTNDVNPRYLENQLRFYVGVQSPGYAAQIFEIPLETARAGKDLVFDLEPAATVTGRVLMARSMKPATGEALDEGRKRKESGQGELSAAEAARRGQPQQLRAASVRLSNDAIDGTMSPLGQPHFTQMAGAQVDESGGFKFEGLRPGGRWYLEVTADGYPPHLRRDLTLKPGANDLGVISIGKPGTLAGFVMDELDNPIANAAVTWPLSAYSLNNRTDAQGGYEVDLATLRQEREIIRVIPPWGIPVRERDSESPFIWFDSELKVDRENDMQLHPKLPRGHNLLIELAATSRTLELARFYSDREHMMIENTTPRAGNLEAELRHYFAIRGAAVLGIRKSDQGFAYHHLHALPEGVELTTQTLILKVPNVPPGPVAVRLDGGFYTKGTATPDYGPGEKPDVALTRDYANCEYGFPIAFAEYEMPDTTGTLKMSLNPVDVELEMKNPPAEPLENNTMVFLERLAPMTTGLTGDVRQIYSNMWSPSGRDPEDFRTPLVSFFGSFVREASGDASKASYQNALFRFVPPGRYRLAVYASMFAVMDRKAPGYFQREIEIKPGEDHIQIAIPYKPYAQPDGFKPALK